MRLIAFLGVLFAVCSPNLAAQTAQTTQTTPSVASNPQAVAVVQAAIKAMGGAVAIGALNSWTLHAQMEGPMVNPDLTYSLTTQKMAPVAITTATGIRHKTPMRQSYFVSVLLGPVLLNESQSPLLSMNYGGLSTVNSKPAEVVVFSISANTPAQIWYFDQATSLPTRIVFKLPAQIGSSKSHPATVEVSDFQTVSGVAYPFSIRILERPFGLPEVVTLLSLTSSTVAAAPDFNGAAGDLSR